jgi:hypothetical protein
MEGFQILLLVIAVASCVLGVAMLGAYRLNKTVDQ